MRLAAMFGLFEMKSMQSRPLAILAGSFVFYNAASLINLNVNTVRRAFAVTPAACGERGYRTRTMNSYCARAMRVCIHTHTHTHTHLDTRQTHTLDPFAGRLLSDQQDSRDAHRHGAQLRCVWQGHELGDKEVGGCDAGRRLACHSLRRRRQARGIHDRNGGCSRCSTVADSHRRHAEAPRGVCEPGTGGGGVIWLLTFAFIVALWLLVGAAV
jgi:hypothetical protein